MIEVDFCSSVLFKREDVWLREPQLCLPSIVMTFEVLLADEFQHSRDMLALEARFSVSPVNEIRTSTGEFTRVWLAEQVIVSNLVLMRSGRPPIWFGFKDLDSLCTSSALFGR